MVTPLAADVALPMLATTLSELQNVIYDFKMFWHLSIVMWVLQQLPLTQQSAWELRYRQVGKELMFDSCVICLSLADTS